MLRYRAEVYLMDSDDVAVVLGNFQSQLEARHHCQRHAVRLLDFKFRRPGLWKAQGTEYWYQIQQVGPNDADLKLAKGKHGSSARVV